MKTNPAISIDLSTAHHRADNTANELANLRRKFNLKPFEYCQQIRIAPFETPYSHPQITLNTNYYSSLGLLCMYLHEQMHWYVTWYSHTHETLWMNLLETLKALYPAAVIPNRPDLESNFSSYLHLIVNWLEVHTASIYYTSEEVAIHASKLPFYQWEYEQVTQGKEKLQEIYQNHKLLPIIPATNMSVRDLQLAQLVDDADATL